MGGGGTEIDRGAFKRCIHLMEVKYTVFNITALTVFRRAVIFKWFHGAAALSLINTNNSPAYEFYILYYSLHKHQNRAMSQVLEFNQSERSVPHDGTQNMFRSLPMTMLFHIHTQPQRKRLS